MIITKTSPVICKSLEETPENKIQKGETTREEIRKKEMTWKQWALLFIGFMVSIIIICFMMILLIG